MRIYDENMKMMHRINGAKSTLVNARPAIRAHSDFMQSTKSPTSTRSITSSRLLANKADGSTLKPILKNNSRNDLKSAKSDVSLDQAIIAVSGGVFKKQREDSMSASRDEIKIVQRRLSQDQDDNKKEAPTILKLTNKETLPPIRHKSQMRFGTRELMIASQLKEGQKQQSQEIFQKLSRNNRKQD